MTEPEIPLDVWGEAVVELGVHERSTFRVSAVRCKAVEQATFFFGFKLDAPDANWRRCGAAFELGLTSADLAQ